MEQNNSPSKYETLMQHPYMRDLVYAVHKNVLQRFGSREERRQSYGDLMASADAIFEANSDCVQQLDDRERIELENAELNRLYVDRLEGGAIKIYREYPWQTHNSSRRREEISVTDGRADLVVVNEKRKAQQVISGKHERPEGQPLKTTPKQKGPYPLSAERAVRQVRELRTAKPKSELNPAA